MVYMLTNMYLHLICIYYYYICSASLSLFFYPKRGKLVFITEVEKTYGCSMFMKLIFCTSCYFSSIFLITEKEVS